MVCLQEPEKATGTDQKLRKVPQRESKPDGKNDDTMRQEMEKAYPGYKFLDAEVKYNQDLAMFYIYARMIKHGSCEDMQKGGKRRKGALRS